MLHSSRILLLCGLFCAGCSASYKQSTTYSDTTTSYAIYTRVGLPHIAAKPAMIPSDQKHSRTLEWNGHDALCIDMPVDVFYEKAEQPAIEVRGGAFAVDSVHIHNGRLSLSDGKCFFSNNKIGQFLMLLLVILTGLARICTGWHWPLDVIASGLIAYLLVKICFAFNWPFANCVSSKLN